MNNKAIDIVLTAIAPVLWGCTYLVTTEFLPPNYPITTSLLRALPSGILLICLTRKLPRGIWITRSLILGASNFTIFLILLFISAYRLPGGVAATLGAVQPLIAAVLAWPLLKQPLSLKIILSGVVGLIGVAMMALTGSLSLDPIGVAAALGSAVALAIGVVLTKKWQPNVSALAFTGWQMTAGGILLIPFALLFEPPLPPLNGGNLFGFAFLGLAGGALAYFLWFRGIAKLGTAAASAICLINTITAALLGWLFLGETLSLLQITGAFLVLAGVWFSLSESGKPKTKPI